MYVCMYPFIYLSIYLSLHLSIYPSIYLSISIHIYLCIYIYIYIYVYVHNKKTVGVRSTCLDDEEEWQELAESRVYIAGVRSASQKLPILKVTPSNVDIPLKLTSSCADVGRGYLGAVKMNYAGRLERELDLFALSWRSHFYLADCIYSVILESQPPHKTINIIF